MRKSLTFLLALVLTLAAALPGFAADYRQAAIDFLAEKHGVPADHVHIYEGDKITLEYSQESFWCAKYEISADGPSQAVPPQPPDAIEPAPPQVMPLPEPVLPDDLPSSGSGGDPDAPVSSTPRYDTGNLPARSNSGVVYIREKTGEVLDEAGMETYFLRERELAAVAWEKLRQEAGKVEVNFYQRLKNAAANEKFSVRIIPAFIETPELTQRFKELQAAYPEYSKGIPSLSELFGSYGNTATLEVVPDIAVPPPSPEAAADTPLIQGEAEGAGSMPAYRGPADDVARDLPIIEEDYEAYHKELEAIRLAGLEASARIITDKLSGLDITYTYDYGVIATELTKAQINDFAALDAVQLISDDMFYAMEEGRSLTGAVDNTAADLDGALPPAVPISEKNTPSPYFLLLAIPLLCAVYWFRRRLSAN